jgi:hypothetical protein
MIKTIRTLINSSNSLAFGCSHTWGVGVEANESWAHLLGAVNHGIRGCSADYIARTASVALDQHQPQIVYILWPDWTRFDVQDQGHWKTMLPTDNNYINFLANRDENWLKDNFYKQVQTMHNLCKDRNIQLIDLSLYDLIPYIDHADCWPLSKLGHHYAPSWHRQVADIFKSAEINNIKHPIAND